MTPETFVHDYWARRALFVKGTSTKFAGLFDEAALHRILEMPGPVPADFLRASFDAKTPDGRTAIPPAKSALLSSVFRAQPDQAADLYAAGATLCLSQIERHAPSLASFLAAIKRQLGYPSKVSFNAYRSPPRSGFNWHFDSRIASTLQIEGTKLWRFSNHPAMPWPRANGSLRADGTALYTDEGVQPQDWERLVPLDLNDTTEVLLEPGDLLILPAGFWHEACGGPAGSLALNLTFSPISYTLLVRGLLDELLTQDAGWRGPAPTLPTGVPGEVDPDGVAAISVQLARAAAVLSELSGDSAAVVRLWESFVLNPSPGFPAPRRSAAETPLVQATQRLRIRNDGNVFAMLADGGTRLCVPSARAARSS